MGMFVANKCGMPKHCVHHAAVAHLPHCVHHTAVAHLPHLPHCVGWLNQACIYSNANQCVLALGLTITITHLTFIDHLLSMESMWQVRRRV